MKKESQSVGGRYTRPHLVPNVQQRLRGLSLTPPNIEITMDSSEQLIQFYDLSSETLKKFSFLGKYFF